jgi:phosphonate transport system substrate-binding protein
MNDDKCQMGGILSQKIRLLIMLFLTISFSVGCSDQQKQGVFETNSPILSNNTAVDQKSEPLQVAVIPARSSQTQIKKLQDLEKYLEETVGRKFELQIQKDYETAVNLLVQEKVQIAYLGPLTYVKAKKLNPQIEPILAPITKSTGRPWHTSMIIANVDKIKDVQDLNNKRFGFVSKSSTTGFLVPTVELFQTIGIEPEKHFREVKFLGSHNLAITALITGEVDAVAVAEEAYIKAQEEEKIDTNKYVKIWESSPLPTDPIVVSTKLNPELINNIKKALIDAPAGIIAISGVETAGYTIVDDLNFESIRKLQSKLE